MANAFGSSSHSLGVYFIEGKENHQTCCSSIGAHTELH